MVPSFLAKFQPALKDFALPGYTAWSVYAYFTIDICTLPVASRKTILAAYCSPQEILEMKVSQVACNNLTHLHLREKLEADRKYLILRRNGDNLFLEMLKELIESNLHGALEDDFRRIGDFALQLSMGIIVKNGGCSSRIFRKVYCANSLD